MGWESTGDEDDDSNERRWQIHRDKMPVQRNGDGTINLTDCGVFVTAAMKRLIRLMTNPGRARARATTTTTGRPAQPARTAALTQGACRRPQCPRVSPPPGSG
eukprot:COSAG02_NODE_948_length_15709_cov_67.728700_7_plen_103_part_00